MLLTHLSRFPLINYFARKGPYEYMHSMRIELAKLILLGTRITYQATGDAGLYEIVYIQTYIMHDKSVDRSQ